MKFEARRPNSLMLSQQSKKKVNRATRTEKKRKGITEDIIPKLKELKGQELSYKELCEKTGLPIKSSNSKSAQMKDLEMYCELDRVEGTNRYYVRAVYDEGFVRELNGNNKYQAIFEAAICQMFLENGDRPLYVSYMDMLKRFNEINYNFSILCSQALVEDLGEEYEIFPKIGQSAYKILRAWTRDKIDYMNTRGVALKRSGFRLYTFIHERYVVHNVIIDSKEEQICQQIWNIAVNNVMPQGWNGEWVSPSVHTRFEEEIKRLVRIFFRGEYDNMKNIIILSPPEQNYVKEMLYNIYKDNPDLTVINDEAGRKILDSTSRELIDYSLEDKERFVDLAIKQNPKIDFRRIVYDN